MELADLVELKPAAISHFETGIRTPAFENLSRLADALSVSIDYLLGRTEAAAITGPGAEMLFRCFSRMSPIDQRLITEMAQALIIRQKVTNGEEPWPEDVEFYAERALRDAGIAGLPVDPFNVAKRYKLELRPFDAMPGNPSCYILREGEKFVIGYSTSLNNPGQINFTIAHAIAHCLLPEHSRQLCVYDGALHSCVPLMGGSMFENQADHFATSLLLPEQWFHEVMENASPGLAGVKELAERFQTPLVATASRYVRNSPGKYAMVVTGGNSIIYGFLSESVKTLVPDRQTRYLKGKTVPEKTLTYEFNSDKNNVLGQREEKRGTYLNHWFAGANRLKGTEETIGLGKNGRTLSLLSFAE